MNNVKCRWPAFFVILFIGCGSKNGYLSLSWDPQIPVKKAMQWMSISQTICKKWKVSSRLVTAIIAVESGGDPELVSKSKAIGLMQLKAATAGKEVYRYMGWKGQPSVSELKKPKYNITMGTVYLRILEHRVLKNIKNPKIMQYALAVSYANGVEKLLHIFSRTDQKKAIKKINDMSTDEFLKHIIKYHPSAQARRYILKIQKAMNAM